MSTVCLSMCVCVCTATTRFLWIVTSRMMRTYPTRIGESTAQSLFTLEHLLFRLPALSRVLPSNSCRRFVASEPATFKTSESLLSSLFWMRKLNTARAKPQLFFSVQFRVYFVSFISHSHSRRRRRRRFDDIYKLLCSHVAACGVHKCGIPRMLVTR